MHLTINSFRQLFPDNIFSPTFPWLLVKSLTFPWQLSNSITFPGFPDKWSPVSIKHSAQVARYHKLLGCKIITDHQGPNRMIVTYDIVALTWHNDIVVLQYRDSESDQLRVYKVLGHITWRWADQPWREQPPCKRRKGQTDVVSFLADSDDEQDRAEPANRPWNSAMI